MKNLKFQLNGFISLLFYCLLLLLPIGDLAAQHNNDAIAWNQALKQETTWYASSEASRIADNILIYQHKSGGWPKNIDMAQPLDEQEIESIISAKSEKGNELGRATMDNGATSKQIRFLARVFEQTGQKSYKESFIKGVNYLLEAQYENGGWPQFYPIRQGYYKHITFNDNAMVNTMHLLKEIYSESEAFASLQLSPEIKEKTRIAFEKGIRCILNTQIYVDGQPTVWCAQHDEVTLAPVKARSYELASFSGSESVAIVQLLMEIDHPSHEIIAAIDGAITWFEDKKIDGIRVVSVVNADGEKDLEVIEDPQAEPLWARFYDLETGEPFFCSRDGIKRNTLAEISHNRRNGYRWYTNAPARILNPYPAWKKKVESAEQSKPRVIISTDIGGTDPDDFQSMIHYLIYADRFDTEGLIASPYGEGRKQDILEMIDLYEQDFPRLKQHGDFPEPDYLRTVTKQGAESFAPPRGWQDQPTEGSRWIVQRANAESDRPLWVLVWGGLEDLAQALHDAPEIEKKIRVYWIGGPNKKWSVHPYLYIARNFPDLRMIEANSTYRGWFIDEGAKPEFDNQAFFEHTIQGKGVMGSAFGNYYQGEIKMGDTPSVAYLLSGEADQPQGESWGGSFIPLPYSAFRPFNRQTTKTDTVPAYSVLEWAFTDQKTDKGTGEPGIWMEIDGQRIDGFYEGDGTFKIRFVPKRAGSWNYTIHCSNARLDGSTGEFVSANPWPGRHHTANIRLNNWWSDQTDKTTYLQQYAGASTVSKWREDFLSDWAVRLDWLTPPSNELEKPRVFVLTDIENEPDDAQSLVRFMTYSNQWEVEGIVATTSCWQRDKTAEWRIHEIIDAYGKVRDNLEVHEKGYPTYDYMKRIIKKGVPKFGMTGVGEGQDSEGSEWLIRSLRKDDPRPLYVQAWGGANVLAQALWKMERTLPRAELDKIIQKIRVYTISDQDDTGPWIRKNFPGIFYVVSPGYEENGGGQYHYATWSGISGDKFHGRFSGPDFTLVDNPWLDEHIRQDHGPLGAEHPHTEYLMEGDTPSFLGLVDNGLNNPERPDFGGWGGRYELYIPPFKKYMYEPETRPIWTNTQDEVWSDITQQHHTSNHATIWRWREAYQHDFAARIDWSNTPEYSEANHPPLAVLEHANELTVKSGEEVRLSGAGSTDPDQDKLQYRWIHYKEVGTLNASRLKLEDLDEAVISFTAPQVKRSETMHLILAVTDDGTPSLTRYQRVIVNIIPK